MAEENVVVWECGYYTDPVTKKEYMKRVRVRPVPCPDPANPDAVEWTDEEGQVWMWSRSGFFGGLLHRTPIKGSRLVPLRTV